MNTGEDEADKDHEPTQKRLDDARERGEVPKSAELSSAFVQGGLALALHLTGGSAVEGLGNLGATLLGQADRLALGGAMAGGVLVATALPVAALFLLPALAGAAGYAVQRAWKMTPSNLAPRLSRVSPLAVARQKFGIEGLAEFLRSLLKLGLIAGLLGYFLAARTGPLLAVMALDPGPAMLVLSRMVLDFLVLALAISAVLGLADLLWQIHRHRQRNRMSRKELTDETKDGEGDPHMRAERRRRGQDIAMNQMLADVAKADVVIVNPTHYAVALKWDRRRGGAPVCVAKGVDEIAARIRERAAEAGVPLRRDPPAARALYASTRIGQEISPDHYRAVAAAIRFAEAMRRRARARGQSR